MDQWDHLMQAIRKKDFATFATRADIPRTRRLGTDLVVMGAVSRSGLKRVFIGNTAERVLNALPCDVLVVKPAHFEKRVPDKVRGMRVVAPQPVFPLPV